MSLLKALIGDTKNIQGTSVSNLDNEYSNSEYSLFSNLNREELNNSEKTIYHIKGVKKYDSNCKLKDLPLNYYTDGKQSVSRISIGNGLNAYFIQIRAGIIENKEINGVFKNIPKEIKALNAVIVPSYNNITEGLNNPIDVVQYLSGNTKNEILRIPIGVSVQDVVNLLRSDLEERLIAKWYEKLPNRSIIIDGGIATRKIKKHLNGDKNSIFQKGMVGIVKNSKMSFLNEEAISEVFNLKYRERSSIFETSAMENNGSEIKRNPVWSCFFKMRPEKLGNPMWGTVMLNITATESMLNSSNFLENLDKAFGNIANLIIERAYGIANDPRWDRELKPISDLEKFMGITIWNDTKILNQLKIGNIVL